MLWSTDTGPVPCMPHSTNPPSGDKQVAMAMCLAAGSSAQASASAAALRTRTGSRSGCAAKSVRAPWWTLFLPTASRDPVLFLDKEFEQMLHMPRSAYEKIRHVFLGDPFFEKSRDAAKRGTIYRYEHLCSAPDACRRAYCCVSGEVNPDVKAANYKLYEALRGMSVQRHERRMHPSTDECGIDRDWEAL